MKILNLIFILLLSTFISSCASLSKEECTLGDWEGIGNSDGLKGLPRKTLSKHQKACSEYGVTVEKSSYLSGHKSGLKSYCKEENAFQKGLNGERYYNVCSSKFAKKFNEGEKIFTLSNELSSVQKEIEGYEDQLDNGANRAQRKVIRREMRDLKKREKILIAKLVYLKSKNGQGVEGVFDLL